MTAPRIKPLVWQNDMLFCGQPHAYADTPLGPWTVTAYDGRGGRWAYDDPSGDTSDMDWPTREEAQAAAQADYETRILAALEPQDAPAVAGVEIPAGYTPGPWWTDGRYDGREMGCPIIAARTDAGPLPGNPTRGMVAFASALLNTDARRCEANARLIALAPAMAEELVALRAENTRLRWQGWQPIETAPRDGTWFWARSETQTRWVHFGDQYDRYPIGENAGCWSMAPTHWSPLPTPPASQPGGPGRC